MAYLEAIKAALGVEKFDALFGESFWIRMNDPKHPLHQLVQHVSYTEVKKGTLVAFNNVKTYTLKHINGEAQAVWTMEF